MERGQLGSYWLELVILTLVLRSLRCVRCVGWKPHLSYVYVASIRCSVLTTTVTKCYYYCPRKRGQYCFQHRRQSH